jgi:hypothetical protein
MLNSVQGKLGQQAQTT